jgi:pyruvate/2-oxoglutarate dehydrogenase complex dihydrolipoamide dehydrogenase (E3) component
MLVSSARLEGRVAAENAVLGPHRTVLHDVVPAGSFTDPEYASVGLTEAQARARYDCAVAVARYEDLLRPVADAQPEGFCKLIIERGRRQIVGAHVLGEYSAEVIQMVANAWRPGCALSTSPSFSSPSPPSPKASAWPLKCWYENSESAPCPRSGAASTGAD